MKKLGDVLKGVDGLLLLAVLAVVLVTCKPKEIESQFSNRLWGRFGADSVRI